MYQFKNEYYAKNNGSITFKQLIITKSQLQLNQEVNNAREAQKEKENLCDTPRRCYE